MKKDRDIDRDIQIKVDRDREIYRERKRGKERAGEMKRWVDRSYCCVFLQAKLK